MEARSYAVIPNRHSLSVIIIASNEADRIRAALESVARLADEIVVVVSNSTDGTADICREYTESVVVTPDWPGDGVQKQRALERATGEWVLRIDADERLSPDLRDELSSLLASESIAETAFTVPWATYVFGRYLTHGECGVRHLNLFRREGSSFSSIVVHSELTPAPGPVGALTGRLLHDAHRSLHHLLVKLADYACLAGASRAASGGGGSLAGAFAKSWARFFKAYVLRLGFLDGWRGLLIATLYSHYVFNKHAAAWVERYPSLPVGTADAAGAADRQGDP